MDIGIIATRYAKALLRYASDQSEDEKVYGEMQQLHASYCQTSRLKTAINSPILTNGQRVKLLTAAATVGGDVVPSASTQKFIELVVQKRRSDLMQFIAISFLHQYEQKNKITTAKLTTAQPVSKQTEERIISMIEKHTGSKVLLSSTTNPALIAGFVLEYADYKMDASLQGKFTRLRRELK